MLITIILNKSSLGISELKGLVNNSGIEDYTRRLTCVIVYC